MSAEAVKPLEARRAAIRPARAACPTWKGLVMVPKLILMPADEEAAMPRAMPMRSGLRASSLAQAAAAAIVPVVAVACQPLA